MADLLLDLALPKTDRAVFIQWAIMAPIWVVAAIGARWLNRDLRHFVWGLCMMNLAWFAVRTVH